MEERQDASESKPQSDALGWRLINQRVPRFRPPRGVGALVRLHWSRVATWLLLLVGLAVQLVIIEAVFELVDLSISLMELWAELARKHLEITL